VAFMIDAVDQSDQHRALVFVSAMTNQGREVACAVDFLKFARASWTSRVVVVSIGRISLSFPKGTNSQSKMRAYGFRATSGEDARGARPSRQTGRFLQKGPCLDHGLLLSGFGDR
jgi:ABC-type hemin transport system ATPase subunit